VYAGTNEIVVTPELKKHCQDRAFVAYGTTWIFDRRARQLRSRRNWITFLGIAVPVTVGSLYLSFNAFPNVFPFILGVAGVILTIQLVMSVWSLVARWDEDYQHSVESMQANTRLFNAWNALGSLPLSDPQARATELDVDDQRQEQQDLLRHVTEKERRFAMRNALFFFKRECVTCKVKPVSMKASDCDTCGHF
jgi:mobilome CxxCx(11)CxxC protein